MKYTILTCILCSTVIAKAEEFRTFTNQEGLSIIARILSYNPNSEKIQLERKGGAKAWVSPGIFSNEDQKFIKIWKMTEPFKNPLLFKISATEDSSSWRSRDEEGQDPRTKEKNIYFIIHFQNKSKIEFNDLQIKSCTYRERKFNNQHFIESWSRTITPTVEVKPQEKREVRINAGTSIKNNPDGFLNVVIGGRFRVYMTLPSGQQFMREVQFPESLSDKEHPWKDPEPNK